MILFFGPPGSGKTVQGQLLVERNGWQWLSTGELFRKSQDPEVLERLATGELIDDALTNRVLHDALSAIDSKIKVILDGYPRNPDQAEWLNVHLPEHGREISCVVVFEVEHGELVRRLQGRGRAEDAVDVIEKRLAIYRDKTKPVLDFYASHEVPVIRIDGMGAIEDIHERIHDAVQACLKLT